MPPRIVHDLGHSIVLIPLKQNTNVIWCVGSKDKKIAEIGRFFGEKSDFGGLGKDFAVEKSTEKISAKNRKIPTFFRKNPIFPEKIQFFPKFGINYILGH